MPENISALISDIQHCCVHDGPGIRTTVFTKGCNMRCSWCHNPETVYPYAETLYAPDKCIGCGQCAAGCYAGARVVCGRQMTVDAVLGEIELDRPYYGADGGVTLSGGEPLLQPRFAVALLEACRRRGIGTAMETNLNVPWETLESAARWCDVVMCDVKMMDDAGHRAHTQAGNRRVLENLGRLSALGVPLAVRTPVVKGLNDSAENIAQTAAFLARLDNVLYYELLSYHPLGFSKGRSEHFEAQRHEKPTRGQMRNLAALAAARGLRVQVDNIPYTKLPADTGHTEAR